MKKVLILGVDGNLGIQVLKSFDSLGVFQVIPFSREDLDFLEYDQIIPKISKIKPDIIINTVAYNNIDGIEDFEDDFENAKKVNGDALEFIARAAIKNNSILIHYSTDYVFGGKDCCSKDGDDFLLDFKERGGFREDDKPCPVNRYGSTRLEGENILLSFVEKGLKLYLIRSSKLFGPKGISNESMDNFFDQVINACRSSKEVDVANEELSCFTYTPDLALKTFDILDQKMDFGIYHITNSGPAIYHDAALEIFKIRGLNIKVNPIILNDLAVIRPKYSVLANTKTTSLRDWREALRDYLKNKK